MLAAGESTAEAKASEGVGRRVGEHVSLQRCGWTLGALHGSCVHGHGGSGKLRAQVQGGISFVVLKQRKHYQSTLTASEEFKRVSCSQVLASANVLFGSCNMIFRGATVTLSLWRPFKNHCGG